MKRLVHGFSLQRFRSQSFVSLFAFSLLGMSSGCKGTEKAPPTPAPVQPAPATPQAVAPPPAHPVAPSGPQLGVEWEVPQGWQEDKKPRMMRAATYFAPGTKGPAEVSVFFFGAGQGGEREANIARWVGQFTGVAEGGVKRSEAAANGLKRFSVSIATGDFSSGMPGQEGVQSGWGMEGAIVETPTGSYYFKMVGPADSVKEQSQAFLQLLESIKLKG